MWIFSVEGFVSIVQHRDQPEHFMVRARIKKDLERFLVCSNSSALIKETPTGDYRFRAVMAKLDCLAGIAFLLQETNYSNFKNAAAAREKDGYMSSRLQAYHDVWEAMHKLQPTSKPSRSVPSIRTIRKWGKIHDNPATSLAKYKSTAKKLQTLAESLNVDELDIEHCLTGAELAELIIDQLPKQQPEIEFEPLRYTGSIAGRYARRNQ